MAGTVKNIKGKYYFYPDDGTAPYKIKEADALAFTRRQQDAKRGISEKTSDANQKRDVDYQKKINATHGSTKTPTAEEKRERTMKTATGLEKAANVVKAGVNTATNLTGAVAGGLANGFDAMRAQNQANTQLAHANRQASIAENAAAETRTAQQRANQIANRDYRVEAEKDAASSGSNAARASYNQGNARALGAGAAGMQAASTAVGATNTAQGITENRSRGDTQAQNSAELATRANEQQMAAEETRARGDATASELTAKAEANRQKEAVAKADKAYDREQNAKQQEWQNFNKEKYDDFQKSTIESGKDQAKSATTAANNSIIDAANKAVEQGQNANNEAYINSTQSLHDAITYVNAYLSNPKAALYGDTADKFNSTKIAQALNSKYSGKWKYTPASASTPAKVDMVISDSRLKNIKPAYANNVGKALLHYFSGRS